MESFFINPSFVIPGAALISSPIIIHLINRLRYRRVRFAAMEFLLLSQQKNRRRILIEQLILLLLRILIVLVVAAIISRLVLSRAQWAILQGKAASHHIVLVDDSGSMQERIGETSAFDRAKNKARRLVEMAAAEPGEQRVSIYFLSQILKNEPDVNLTNQEANQEFIRQVITSFENVKCTYQNLDLEEGLKQAGRKLQEGKDTRTAVKYIHVLSDFRSEDWQTQTSLVDTVTRLTDADVAVNFVRTIQEGRPNLAITRATAAVETAAVDVPMPVKVAVRNFGDKDAEDVQVRIVQDGTTLPRVILFDRIEAGKEVEKDAYLFFKSPRDHRLRFELPVDALAGDNFRYLAVENLPQVNRVLLVDGDPTGQDGFDVKNALSADPSVSGVQLEIEGVDFLRRNPLDGFQCIFLINISNLAPDALAPLERYVQAGGGLLWFMGDRVNPSFYNDKLYQTEAATGDDGKTLARVTGLFPVPLGVTSEDVKPAEGKQDVPPLMLDDSHPVFNVLSQIGFAELARNLVRRYRPVSREIPTRKQVEGGPREWDPDDAKRKDGVATLASLRTPAGPRPLFLEHQYGRGRVLTCLTSAGLSWHDWPKLNHYPVLMLRSRDYVVQKASDRQRIVGEPLSERLPSEVYSGNVEIESPDLGVGVSTRWEAKNIDAPDDDNSSQGLFGVDYPQTGLPGIYKLDLGLLKAQGGGTNEVRMYAYNVPAQESATKVVEDEEVLKHFPQNDLVKLYAETDETPFAGKEPEQELRMALLAILLVLLIGEQLMAFRLSFHTRDG